MERCASQPPTAPPAHLPAAAGRERQTEVDPFLQTSILQELHEVVVSVRGGIGEGGDAAGVAHGPDVENVIRARVPLRGGSPGTRHLLNGCALQPT